MTIEQWLPKLKVQPSELTVGALQGEVWLQTTSKLAESQASSITLISTLTHDADLSDLWDYYELEISQGRMRRDKIAAKECNQRCKHYAFTYPASVICRHPTQFWFAKRLIDLQYRYCKDCSILTPKSLVLELEQIRELRKPPEKRKPTRTEATPIKCPCCSMKTAYASVLIRRTKMGRKLFEQEGY